MTPPLSADQLNTIAKSSGYTGGTFSSTGLLNSSTLSPQANIQVQPPAPSMGVVGALGNLEQFTKTLGEQADAAKTASDSANTDWLKELMDGQGQAQLTDAAYKNGVDPAAAKLNAAKNELLQEQVGTRHQIEALQKNNPQGLFGTGLQQQVDKINSESLTRQADIAVKQLAAQGEYDGAKAIADRAVAAQAEIEQNKINALKANADNMRADWSKDEQRQFDSMLSDRQRRLDEQTYEQRARFDALIKAQSANQGGTLDTGPVSTIQTADGSQAVASYTLNPGDDPYNIAQENGTDMATLQKLNPTITDWTKLPPGTQINLPNSDAAWLNGKTSTQIASFNALPANDKSSVQQLVTGSALVSDLVKSRGASGTADIARLVSEAQKIDPTFSINTNKVRYNFLQNWNNPNAKSSVVRNSINTALGHLADFKTSADALDAGQLRGLNNVKNILDTATGDSKVLNVRTDINALATEIATIYKGGTQPSEKEIRNWEETIATDFSKGQFTGVSNEISKLLTSKITATRYQYSSTMGQQYPQSIIDPDKRQALLDAGIDPNSIANEKLPGAAASAAPAGGGSSTQFDNLFSKYGGY